MRLSHDGVSLLGDFQMPAGVPPRATMMMMHTGLGIGSNVRNVAQRLLAMGYAVLLSDMFGEGLHGDVTKAGPAFQAMQENPGLIRERARLWYDALAARDDVDAARIAAIGYCFGGQCVLELARSGADVKAAISFHGLLKTPAPALPGAITCKLIAWCGGQDPYAPQQDIAALRSEMAQANADAQIIVFEHAQHGFTDPDNKPGIREGIVYDADCDAKSWAGSIAILDGLFS